MSGGGSRTVGIDFGTSTTLVSESFPGGAPELVPIGTSTLEMPSLVGWKPDLEPVVGERAEQEPIARVLRSVKRAITRHEHFASPVPGSPIAVPVDDAVRWILAEVTRRSAGSGVPLDSHVDIRLGCPAMWTGVERQRLLAIARSS